MKDLIATIAFLLENILTATPHRHESWVRLFGNTADFDARLEAAKADRGLFSRPDEALCREQQRQSGEGRTTVELVKSIYGYTVRYASGLQGKAVLFTDSTNGRCKIAGQDGEEDLYAASFARMAKTALEWAQDAPTRRDVVVYKRYAQEYGLVD